ncbi:MAG: helix-turn-helix transcriptional regulator [Selenomonas sp.]|nr:helix-turn-helix transcriptional regulator [Selenomonas sp.]
MLLRKKSTKINTALSYSITSAILREKNFPAWLIQLRLNCHKILVVLELSLVHREQFNEVPPHVEYSLTDMGHDLLPVFYAIMNWGFKYEKEIFEVKEDK